MQSKIDLIGVAGFAGSGKNEAVKVLQQRANVCVAAFADPIKRMIEAGFSHYFDPADLWGPSPNRDKTLPIYGPGNQRVSLRRMLQTLGTEWGRGCIADDIWMQVMRTHITHWRTIMEPYHGRKDTKRRSIFFITDVRFFNERDMILDLGGQVLFINRPVAWPKPSDRVHTSEREMLHCDFIRPCIEVVNNGSLSEYHAELSKTFDALGISDDAGDL